MVMREFFIKKYWEEGDIIFLIHFRANEAIRQIEIKNDVGFLTTLEKPVNGESMLLDQDIEFNDEDVISEEIFDLYWKKYDKMD